MIIITIMIAIMFTIIIDMIIISIIIIILDMNNGIMIITILTIIIGWRCWFGN